MSTTDQTILDLIGDLANYAGLPGPQIPPNAPGSCAAQHPLQPLLAQLVFVDDMPFVKVGGANQRCLLPNAVDGMPNPCTNITEESLQIQSNTLNAPRYDIIEGQAYVDGSGNLNAQFTYKQGVNPGQPPVLDPNNAAVVQIIVPASGAVTAADVQVVLPSLTFTTAPATGQSGQLGTGIPLMAAVVTAQPFNTPYVPGNAQALVMPTEDAMPAIQSALTFLGPGGAIYVPSGTYGVASTATTISGKLAGASMQLAMGQTIIFGGQVTFVALTSSATAFEFDDGAVTVGVPSFYDIGAGGVLTTTTAAISFTGIGSTYMVHVGSNAPWSSPFGQTVVICDAAGNTMTAVVMNASGTTEIQIQSTAEEGSDGTIDPGSGYSIAAGATVVQPITVGAFAVRFNGRGLTIDGIISVGWANGVTIEALGDSEIGSLRCKGVRQIGVLFTNASGDIHDSHIGSIYVDGGGAGTCGVDFDGTSGHSLNSLKIDHIECLGFAAGAGPPVAMAPHGAAGICGAGVCIRGTKPQSIQIGILFTSGCGIGLYVDAGVRYISVALLNSGGDGSQFGSTKDGYNVACGGTAANPINDVYIGYARLGRSQNSSASKQNRNGIYLAYAFQFHCDYAFVGDRNQDGVYLGAGSQSIGFDHLILLNNGAAGSYSGITAAGTRIRFHR